MNPLTENQCNGNLDFDASCLLARHNSLNLICRQKKKFQICNFHSDGRGESSDGVVTMSDDYRGHPKCSLIETLYDIGRYSGTLQILYQLSAGGSCSKSVLRTRLPISQEAIDNALRALMSNGLVDCSQQKKFPFAKIINLSEKGTNLVESPLVDWPSILKG
jgi:DNA-binding HxlR family transcriptional regulator